ncbi:MAG: RNA polymerase sigma factor [Planctomycetota bacterium]|nr:RNA polymerase sigma factor [Planctomycetota bacterium]
MSHANSDPKPQLTGSEPRAQALPQLVEQEGPRLHALARRFCPSREDAEDLVQEVFLTAFRTWDQFRGDSKVSTWLYTIASRACMKMQRKKVGEPDDLDSLDDLLPKGELRMATVPGPDGDPLSDQVRAEGRMAVQQAIADLPESFRMPIVLREIVGLSLADIGGILQIPEATVKTRLHRARLKLRQALVENLPVREVPPFNLEKAICLDLLEAKQTSLDLGLTFDFPPGVFCERCSEVFRTMDLTQQFCSIAPGEEWPAELGRLVLKSFRE